MEPIPSFEFCAFEYLSLWLEYERKLHAAISSAPTESDVHGALSYFGVARTFKGLADPGIAATILQSLNEVLNDSSLAMPHKKVDALAKNFSDKFHKVNLSAASKLLWLACRGPFIIYDNRAVKALSDHFGRKFSSYEEYAAEWREEFGRNERSIRAAVQALPKGRIFLRSCDPDDQALLEMASETWFIERVFDIYLWEIGIDKPKSELRDEPPQR